MHNSQLETLGFCITVERTHLGKIVTFQKNNVHATTGLVVRVLYVKYGYARKIKYSNLGLLPTAFKKKQHNFVKIIGG